MALYGKCYQLEQITSVFDPSLPGSELVLVLVLVFQSECCAPFSNVG